MLEFVTLNPTLGGKFDAPVKTAGISVSLYWYNNHVYICFKITHWTVWINAIQGNITHIYMINTSNEQSQNTRVPEGKSPGEMKFMMS